ncbi:uncharacterized protein LOC144630320 isoform X2 [Oculina patagonica]
MSQDRKFQETLNFIREGNLAEARRILLESGYSDKSNPLLKKKFGQFKETAVHLAVKYGHKRIVKLLLEMGADIHATDLHKRTVLHTAANENEGIDIIKLILKCNGVDVNALDGFGNTPVKLAAEKGNSDAVRLLMENGADVTIADKGENITLHVAAKKGHVQVLEMLLNKLANTGIIGKQNKDRNTPLHLAVESQSQHCVAMLLNSGAASTMDVKNENGQTAAELAKDYGEKEIIKFLENPQKAKELFQDKAKQTSPMPVLGGGGSVEADKSFHVNANQVIVSQQYSTTVNGGIVAVGPGSQVVKGQDPTAIAPLLPIVPGDSHYEVNVTGGNASVGDYSVINVSTGTPSSLPVQFPFLLPSEETPTEKANASLPRPVQEEFPPEKAYTSLSSPVQDEFPLEKEYTSLSSLVQDESPSEKTPGVLCTLLFPLFKMVTTQPPPSVDESFFLRAIMKFEAKHEECLRVCPYIKNGEVVLHFYVYSGKSGIPPTLKTAAQEFFREMGVKLEWSDLYNDAYNILNVTPIEYPSGEPNRLEASQIDEIDEIINKNLHVFSKHRNITALQPSFKVTKSVQTEEACIAVYVLGKGNIPIGESAIPSTIGSYPVDVVNGFCVRTKEPKKPTKAQKQKKVISLGASIGVNGEQSSGTLGAVVEDANSGTLYALSCDHVMNHTDTSEIIHPGLDVYLNYLHYHLNEYKKSIDKMLTEPDFELPQISADILKDPEKLLEKFNELKTIKERKIASTTSSEDTLPKSIRKHEKVLEKSFSKPPRIVANYSAGIRRNVVSTKYGKEHFIDAAISELKEDEQSNLKRSKTTEIIESEHYPSGECIPATTAATMNVEELLKSGSATGFTESSLLVGASISPPMTIQAFRQQGDSPWIDVECIICDKREAAQSQGQELSSPCEVCKPQRWLKSCLVIQKQGPGSFSDQGDSGAVIFEKRRKKGSVDDYQTSCPGFGIIFAVHKSSYFDFTIASPLEMALEALSQKVSDLRPDSKPCELRLTSRFN